jgi:hypothetical protein
MCVTSLSVMSSLSVKESLRHAHWLLADIQFNATAEDLAEDSARDLDK